MIKDFILNLDDIVYLTFETPRDYNKGIEDDLRNMEYFLDS